MLSEGVAGGYAELGFKDEKEDDQVDHMVGMICDEFPFEHNSWQGGTKVEDVAGKCGEKKVVETDFPTKEEGENESDEPEGRKDENKASAGSHSPRNEPTKQFGNNDIHYIIRMVADAFEERVIGMFAGYTTSMKDHFDTGIMDVKNTVATMVKENPIGYKRHDFGASEEGTFRAGDDGQGHCAGAEGSVYSKNPGAREGKLDLLWKLNTCITMQWELWL